MEIEANVRVREEEEKSTEEMANGKETFVVCYTIFLSPCFLSVINKRQKCQKLS